MFICFAYDTLKKSMGSCDAPGVMGREFVDDVKQLITCEFVLLESWCI